MRPSPTSRHQRSFATVGALVVVAIVAIFQTIVIVLYVSLQRDAAHIIDISGAQRMRSQELAYFALSLGTNVPEPHAATKIATVIAEMRAVRAEIRREPQYTGPLGRDGKTALGRLVESYIATVHNVERHPHDPRAVARLAAARPIMLAAYDLAVKSRVHTVSVRNYQLLVALVTGLLAQLGSIVGVWFAFVRPAELRNHRLLSDVRAAREEIESTFAGNPDAISVYDETGHIIRVNASRAELIGDTAKQIIGKHYSEVVSDAAGLETTKQAFDRAMAGEIVKFNVAILGAEGVPIDVSATMFPRVIDDVPVGVNIVAKDIRPQLAAQAAEIEQTGRLSDLYSLASAHGRTAEEQLTSAIELVASRLGYDYGVVTEISNDLVAVVATSGDPLGLAVGSVHPLRSSLSQLAINAPDLYEQRDFLASPHATPSVRDFAWKSVAGMKIFVGEVLYGTVGFASKTMRGADLSEADRGFVRLACALLGTIIERGRQMRHLDSLAFSDVLTGLPNRARFDRRMAEAIAGGSTFALHYVDLDRFKSINDELGHGAGDMVLRVTAKRLLHCTRPTDTVVRLGGDEFAIVQQGPVDRNSATLLSKRIVEALSQKIDLGNATLETGASVGVAVFPEHGRDARELLNAADVALYVAKRGGRRCFAYADPRAVPISA